MRRCAVLLLFLVPIYGYTQSSGHSAQNALNNYIEYANQSADEVASLFSRINSYYQELKYYRTGKKGVPDFPCGNALNDYYLKKAISESTSLSNAPALNTILNRLRAAAENLDQLCKTLDTYHQLEDYKRDNFSQADVLIEKIRLTLVEYRHQRSGLAKEVETTFRKLQANALSGPYTATDNMMRKEIERERVFLDSWTYNLQEDVHTGWPVEKLEASILETTNAIAAFKQSKPVLKYPASTMYGSFIESLTSMMTTKQSGLDGYNFEAKKSDKHSNQVYLDLINYFNGTMVSDQNTFLKFSQPDGYYGLTAMRYVPLFEIRKEAKQVQTEVVPFLEIPYATIKVVKQSISLPKSMFAALGNYIEFINESLRQTDYLERILRNYNSDARYYKDLTSYKGKGGMSYNHKDFAIPLSAYQTLKSQSTTIPVGYRKSLNDQAEVLLNILKEMDQLSVALNVDASERRYEKDNLKRGYEILERFAKLFETFNTRKEQLYLDVRSIYESYAVSNPASSWIVSNNSLLILLDEDKAQLFKAKA